MSSVMPFTFNNIALFTVTVDGKPWTNAREVCRALQYKKKTAHIAKHHCSKGNFTQKYQMSGVPMAGTPMDWPKDSQKYDIYINEKTCTNWFLEVNSQKQKTLESTAVMCYFHIFDSNLQTSWKKTISKPSLGYKESISLQS